MHFAQHYFLVSKNSHLTLSLLYKVNKSKCSDQVQKKPKCPDFNAYNWSEGNKLIWWLGKKIKLKWKQTREFRHIFIIFYIFYQLSDKFKSFTYVLRIKTFWLFLDLIWALWFSPYIVKPKIYMTLFIKPKNNVVEKHIFYV